MNFMTQRIGDRHWRWALLGLLAVLAAVVGIGGATLPLAEPDEARYAEIAREMAEAGDWVVPRLQGEVFRDKPPLVFWVSASAYAVFGVEDWAARLPVLIAAVVGLLVTWHLARGLYGPETAILAAVVLATCPLYYGMGEILTLDMPLALWTTIGMAAVWRSYASESRGAARIAWVAAALGVLTKGPIAAVLIGLPAALFLAALRDGRAARRALDPIGVVLFLVIAVPWFFAVEQRVPGYLAEFVFHHHIERFVNPWHHREPMWFYLPVLLVGLFPWSVLWLTSPGRGRDLEGEPGPTAKEGFLGLFAIWPVVVFSLSSSKLIPYVLPALPPLAILLAATILRRLRAGDFRFLRRGGGLLAGAGGISMLVGVVLVFHHFHWRGPLIRPYLLAGGAGLLFLGILASESASRRLGRRSLVAIISACLVVGGVAQFARAELVKNSRVLGLQARTALAGSGVLWSYREYSPALDFYAGREAQVVPAGEERLLPDLAANGSPDVVMVSDADLDSVAAWLGRFRIVGHERNHSLLVRDP
jgi:4-amino-4-deoxy-L-arabinose transferase-like glycosyltransferase